MKITAKTIAYASAIAVGVTATLASAKLKVPRNEGTTSEYKCFNQNLMTSRTDWITDSNTFDGTPFYIEATTTPTSLNPNTADKLLTAKIVLDLGNSWQDAGTFVANTLKNECETEFRISNWQTDIPKSGISFTQQFKVDVDFYACAPGFCGGTFQNGCRAPGKIDSTQFVFTGGVSVSTDAQNAIKVTPISINNNPGLPSGVKNFALALGGAAAGPLGAKYLETYVTNRFDIEKNLAKTNADGFIQGIAYSSNAMLKNISTQNAFAIMTNLKVLQPEFYWIANSNPLRLALIIPITAIIPLAVSCDAQKSIESYMRNQSKKGNSTFLFRPGSP